tara:strand:+ start:682 stop:1539 length:858 start_codon:yes stop_codon:yes gene_type:complete
MKELNPSETRCFVTGHRGYIGSRLFAALKVLGFQVEGIDLKDGEDILDGLDKYLDFKPHYVFHLACIPRVAYSVERPVYTTINNVISTSIVLDYAKKVGAHRVIYSGSSSIVGNGDGPTNPYGLQKLTSEIECKLYAELYGIDTVTLRYFNVYSKDQKVTGPYATAIANWMHYIKNNKRPYITGDGEQRRDMLHVSDAVSANIFAMYCDEDFNGLAYDVGTGTNISLNEVKDIVTEYHPEVEFEYVEPRPGDVLLTKAKASGLEERGWCVKYSIEKGIRECFSEL